MIGFGRKIDSISDSLVQINLGTEMRVFKTKEFVRLARRESVDDFALCWAIERAENGLIDAALGKFLIKLRVARKNEGRSGGFRAIVYFREGDRAVFLHMFSKNDKSNLTRNEEQAYRELAKTLASINPQQVEKLLEMKKWIEIDYENRQKEVS